MQLVEDCIRNDNLDLREFESIENVSLVNEYSQYTPPNNSTEMNPVQLCAGEDQFEFKRGGVLCEHDSKYKKSQFKINQEMHYYNEINDITTQFQTDRIEFIKYTNSFRSVKTGS